MAKAKGEWKSKELASFEDNSGTWKAQLVLAPDESKFIGIRKFVTKKDGTEVLTSAGFNLPYQEGVGETLEGLIGLLQDLSRFAKKRGK